eukprot:875895_1
MCASAVVVLPPEPVHGKMAETFRTLIELMAAFASARGPNAQFWVLSDSDKTHDFMNSAIRQSRCTGTRVMSADAPLADLLNAACLFSIADDVVVDSTRLADFYESTRADGSKIQNYEMFA